MQDAVAADERRLASTRERFLTSTTEAFAADQVRKSILDSWWRSRRLRVPADKIVLPYVREPDLDSPLIRAATPVLERLGDQLDGQPISLILTDPTGVVLTQRTGDADLHRKLERVELVPGFSYGEQFVGTNGIGTALEEGRPTHVFGHEHYAENLEVLACAGAPILHPVTGKLVGAVDLTCWSRDAGRLLVALAQSAAEQISQTLLTHSNPRELALFQAYLRACRRTNGIVLAFNDGLVMMNDHARQLLDPADQSVLIGHATQAVVERRTCTADVALPTGSKVRSQCRKVFGQTRNEVAGVVLCGKLIDSESEGAGVPEPRLPMFLPGAVGSAPLWLRCAHDVDSAYNAAEWLVLGGDPGVGKTTLARCVHQRRHPTGRVHLLDAANADADWPDQLRRELVEDPVDALVIRHVDRLSGSALATTMRLLRLASPTTWVAATMAENNVGRPELAELRGLFPRTVRVPPLRRHVEDLSELVPLFLNRLGHGGQLTCSPAAMHLLMRFDWPGNVAELHHVLKLAVQHRRTGTIQPGDLPAEFRTLTRRPLSRLESMERDAIVQGLADSGGNKVQTAQLLGMSRATLYRKIHEYGIVTPER
ncbi:sigma-54-dependent Fis family transcriptional regulator [Kutzneria sp. CA-103260]|uniref:sigma-54-dependent Fis family transcriptional regulator n=1 Tax=Kutzneria sp. CA-103260 TaxID=2802641 RepID=UPI001BA9F21A|nr:GAF domain-containing protein [Kutzneria sp. CA-103260]QUQ66484.1 Fis family transcriptional regulator [Kutzneria sp. CA-103260]